MKDLIVEIATLFLQRAYDAYIKALEMEKADLWFDAKIVQAYGKVNHGIGLAIWWVAEKLGAQ